ncbi:MAG: STAS domain-containing protein [Kiritimatiellaeota bacterium]|nr:STAS domain-containing protein [Kiritimatiellota bacterium]
MIVYEKKDDEFICRFSGRMDTADAVSSEDELIDKVQHAGSPVVFDFAELEYVASSFLRSCVKVVRVAGPTKIKVKGASKEIQRIFDMTGFGKLMDIQQG